MVMKKKIVCTLIVFTFLSSAMLLSRLREVKGTVVFHSSIHQGDLVLTGDNVTTIEGMLDINGSIIVEENATLILKNAIVNFTQTKEREYNMTFQNPANGNPRMLAENTTLTSAYSFKVCFYGNSSATADRLEAWPPPGGGGYTLSTCDSSVVSISNSKIYSVTALGSSVVEVFNSTMRYMNAFGSASVNFSLSNTNELKCFDFSAVNVSNSTITYACSISSGSVNCHILGLEPGFFSSWNYSLDCSVVVAPDGCAPEVRLRDSQIECWTFYFHGVSNASISNSTLWGLETGGSSVATASNSVMHWVGTHQHSVLRLVNSTYTNFYNYDQSEVYVCWYLGVHVIDSEGTDVPSANVTATYPNAMMAESQLTDVNGWVKLTLMERMMNATGSYPIGNYTVTARYETHEGQQSVNMTENQQITITLPFIIPEFPTTLILPLLVTITLIATILRKKLQSRSRK